MASATLNKYQNANPVLCWALRILCAVMFVGLGWMCFNEQMPLHALLQDEPLMATLVKNLFSMDWKDWLALKILAVGAIFCAGVLLDLLFKPAVDLFLALAETPDDAALNAAYSQALSPVYIAVLAIYAFALIAAGLAVVK